MRKIIAFTCLTLLFLSAVSVLAGKELILNGAMKRDVGRLIRDFGYNCPEPKLAYVEGQDHYGTVTKIYCGPADQPGVYENAVFRLTITPDNNYIVSPWK